MINVLLSMRVVDNATYPEKRDALAHDFPRFLETLGIRAIPVPNVSSDPEGYLGAVSAGGIILTGGNDPAFVDENAADVSPERDNTETRLARAAIETGLPLLGVCRGLQIINHYFGGRASQIGRHHIAQDHEVRFRREFLDRPKGSRMTVNSYHGIGVRPEDVGDGLQVAAESDDGIVECIVHDDLDVTAVQWHPERHSPSAAFDTILMKDWLSRCAK